MILDVVDTLCDLVRIPSVNPMGRDVAGEIYWEHRVTHYLEELFQRLELPFERYVVSPQRDNIIVRVDGDIPPERGGKIVMFEAHQDTVPVDGMTIPPFLPTIRDGKVFGRGSCDIKGGMAAMLSAAARLAHEKPAGRPTLILACTVNEEHGFTGATHWARTYADAASPQRSKILPRVPDATIVAEPTQLNVVVAHKGAVRWRCTTTGVATHSSQPQMGDNAVYHMARALLAFERYAKEVAAQQGEHPLVGRPTLSVGTIAGGISVNTVPDRCSIEIDRRVLPGENPDSAFEHVVAFIEQNIPAGTPVVNETPFMRTFGLADTDNGEVASRLGDIIRKHGGPGERIGVPFGTDAPHFAATGSPTVVFGPGSIAQAHTADEWLSIDQLRVAADILYDFAKEPI
jgi:acetylornithine deacetylase